MEVAVHRRVEEEEVVEQLQTRRRRPESADANSDDDNGNVRSKEEGTNGKSVYFDKSEGKTLVAENVDIPELVKAITNNGDRESDVTEEILSVINKTLILPQKEENIASVDDLMEDSDEEIELEFERAVDKVHTHTPYCPKCNCQITKVILRRKKKDRPRQDKSLDLFGCLKCFSIFVPSGNCLNLKNIFKWGGEQGNDEENKESGKLGESNNGRQKSTNPKIAPPPSSSPNEYVSIGIADESGTHGIQGGVEPSRKLEGEIEEHKTDKSKYRPEHDEDKQTTTGTYQRSKSLEILKCIVYGGLIECIASLSVVSSAAASDASTLNIIAIGLATLFSGLIVFCHNLADLKNEEAVHNPSSSQHKDKYHELLGTRGHFVLHASFAVLSYLVFGLLPPVTYGFMFRESDNKDYKLLSVAVASFACVFLLAVAKAYARRPEKYSAYFRTPLYYVMMAVSVSGVSYAAGDLVGVLMERVGWFEPAQAVLVTSATPAWASY